MATIILITENDTDDGFTVRTEILTNPYSTDVEIATATAGHMAILNAINHFQNRIED